MPSMGYDGVGGRLASVAKGVWGELLESVKFDELENVEKGDGPFSGEGAVPLPEAIEKDACMPVAGGSPYIG